jgi:hypothetical protein
MSEKPRKRGFYKHVEMRPSVCHIIARTGRFMSTQCEALCHSTLTVLRVLSFTRVNFISVFVVLIYQSFFEFAIRIFRRRAKVAYITCTGNISASLSLSARSSLCIPRNLTPNTRFVPPHILSVILRKVENITGHAVA